MRPVHLAFTYMVIASSWIVLSDGLLTSVGLTSQQLVTYSLAKGMGFVLLTGASLYVLVSRYAKLSERREREYRELFEHNPNPMWFYDIETLEFLRVNDAAVSKYGYSAEEFARMTIADIRPPEDLDRLHANLDVVRSGTLDLNESGAWRHLTNDGRILWVDVTSHATEFEGRRAEAVLIRDLTEAHAARQELFRLQQESLQRKDVERFGPA